MSILNELNKKQKEAAKIIDGQVLILAGAGSGKTRTITYRIAYMIEEKNIKPYNILAVTFTNKAAKEMKDRLEKLVGAKVSMTTISTFHSLGVKLLRQYGEVLGYTRNFTIYDSDDSKRLIKNILKEFKIDDKNKNIKDIINKVFKMKETENFTTFTNIDEIAKTVLEKYDKYLKDNNAMDFSDLLINTYKLLLNKSILDKIQEKFKYIMIDEYQDTNEIQYKIIKTIASKYKNICVVGDENQSIYSFRGANIKNILNFEADYKDAKVIKLEENYRSTPTILNAANAVIKNNSSSLDKKLWTNNKDGEKIEIIETEDGREEVKEVITRINNLIDKGYNYKDITILYRTNAQSRVFEESLIFNKIKYKIFGGLSFYSRAEVKDILAYLSVIANTRDELNLLRIINIPKRGIGDKSIEKIVSYARTNHITLYEALQNIDNIDSLSLSIKNNIKALYNIIEEHRNSLAENTASQIVENLIKTINFNEYLRNNYDNYQDREENINELINSIYEFEDKIGYISLVDYLENIALVSDTDNLEDENNYVKLMTIHNSKGLEFPIVFLVGLENDLFPKNFIEVDELEEERRLMYVAITRAEKIIYISFSNNRFLYNKNFPRTKSIFIKEIPEEFIKEKIKNNNLYENTIKQKTKIDDFIPKKNIINISDLKNNVNDCPFKKGDKVKHIKLGIGLVLNVDNKKISISFMDGQKDISVKLADKFLTKL